MVNFFWYFCVIVLHFQTLSFPNFSHYNFEKLVLTLYTDQMIIWGLMFLNKLVIDCVRLAALGQFKKISITIGL